MYNMDIHYTGGKDYIDHSKDIIKEMENDKQFKGVFNIQYH